ncbi:hypothetical protein B5C34_07225 [Pacificimonas flava]|uniref:Short-chain dehydrogenase n=2 Tax=Pacificimonas TaxID=1960290 RepID=A0A219B4G2_9SPHN|nr:MULTISPECIES: SDR family oxidoreductase [Pacificimonas]MBZ6379544.1 SDR family oxidoreductase [Pacificimonas aurantium]OWV33272.1 hypothetical protein B5C34_07225 [Pacificimonas flava]
MTSTAVVIGATGGIGGAIARELKGGGRYDRLVALCRSGNSVDGFEAGTIDVEDEETVQRAAAQVGEADLVIVATGLLHGDGYGPEKTYRSLSEEGLARAFQVNAIGPALVAKHFLPLLRREGRSVFAALSARVGSIADNRLGGWYGYRASKAALNQLIRTLAIEHRRKFPNSLCVALHPGTVDTALSKPFQSNVAEDKLFSAAYAARQLLTVIDGLDPEQTGRIFAWDGQEIEP